MPVMDGIEAFDVDAAAEWPNSSPALQRHHPCLERPQGGQALVASWAANHTETAPGLSLHLRRVRSRCRGGIAPRSASGPAVRAHGNRSISSYQCVRLDVTLCHVVGEVGQASSGVPGSGSQDGEGLFEADAEVGSDESVGLLDDNPGVQRALQLRGQRLSVAKRAVLDDDDSGDVCQCLADRQVFVWVEGV
jgi:hypothetical protein